LTGIRLGVLGGSFNPVHLGHLHVARQCRELLDLSRVLFTVAAVPPHKPPQELIAFAHRYAMVSLATAGIFGFVPATIELEPPASGYSLDTLAKLSRQSGIGGKDIFFLAGGDSLLDVAAWYRSAALLESYNFVFVMRPGVPAAGFESLLPPEAAARVVDCRGLDSSAAREQIAPVLASAACHIFLVDTGAPDIAASRIRSLIAQGRSIDDLVPAAVQEYIRKLHLYGDR
jgi:nicotinate-nucleotide adenylyltransferase